VLINSDHARWIAATATVTVAAAVAYELYAASEPYGPSGGSWPGLFFGIVGTVLMAVAAFLSARKKARTWRLGSAQLWMKMHIWFGLLAVAFILFHSGFRLGGPLTTVLMVLFYVVVASGIVGLALQQLLPSIMTARVTVEAPYGQIDHVAQGLAVDAYEIVASATGPVGDAAVEQAVLAAEEERLKARPAYWKQVPRQRPAAQPEPGADVLKAFYLGELRPYLRRTMGARLPAPDFRPVMLEAPAEWHGKLTRLQQLAEESRQLEVQLRLHRWLHSWLFLHAPLSFALFALVALHIIFALGY
jgi:hypothetical protein